MRDLLLQCSGLAAIAVALVHGVLGETKVFARATIEPARLRTLIRLVWQAGTVAWIGGGVLLARRALDGVGAGAALDRRDARLRVRVRRAGAMPGLRAAGISDGWRSARWSRWRSPDTSLISWVARLLFIRRRTLEYLQFRASLFACP